MSKMSTAQARDLLHSSENKVARSLLGRIATNINFNEIPTIHNDIETSHNEKLVSDAEYEALTRLCNDIIIEKNAIRIPGTEKEFNIASIFSKRIWSKSDISKVIQFRNIVTDMLMLEFVSLDEYIELNNEIDRYIQYTLSDGGIK